MYEATSTRGLEEEEWEHSMGVSVEDSDSRIMLSRVGLHQLTKNRYRNAAMQSGMSALLQRSLSLALIISKNE